MEENLWFLFSKRKNKTDFTNLKNIDNGRFEFGLIQLGNSVPTAHTLQKVYGIYMVISVFPISEGESGGSANQNYSIFLNSGISKKWC